MTLAFLFDKHINQKDIAASFPPGISGFFVCHQTGEGKDNGAD